MPRYEHDREDLMAEAKALIQRASIRVPPDEEPMICGFRRDGSASFFFSSRRVYQFNAAGALRRAFVGELLYKADAGRLAALRRRRTAEAVELVRHDLDPGETQELMADLRRRLDVLAEALASGRFELLDAVPPRADLVARIVDWLAAHPGVPPIAGRPGVR